MSSESSSRPRISVILPNYNGAKTLEKSIQSILTQARSGVELIVIDGGSTDQSVAIIEKYNSEIASWVSEADQGVYDAMNKGVTRARGEWIYFLGADDEALPNFDSIALALQDSSTIYYGDVQLSSSGKRHGGHFDKLRLLRQNIPHQGMFYPRLVFQHYQYDLRYRMLADYALNLQCICDRRFKFSYLSVAVAKYNDVSGLSSTVIDKKFQQEKRKIVASVYPKHIYFLYSLYRLLKH